ncbi:ribose-5-phosphate isomerase-like [Oppia nitens]|uniref:ribose-5-phosphate isomerase-like n=1 Tax=Oppia nitens TaxID=1686743 RepID=UPI0023D9DA0E|nr:ribose-5-phosphate isomerase-like [Oppia nitens]
MPQLAKKVAAFAAVDNHVKNGFRVGIGSGTTIVFAVERIRELNLKDVICVPVCQQSRQVILDNSLKLAEFQDIAELDVFIDGFDEVDVHTRTVIFGTCTLVTAVKIFAAAAKHVVFVGDQTKRSEKLGQTFKVGIPVEVIPLAHKQVIKQIESQFKGKALLRKSDNDLKPTTTLSFNNYIIDWQFPDDIKNDNFLDIYNKVKAMAGSIEMGLVFDATTDMTIYMGATDGTLIRV